MILQSILKINIRNKFNMRFISRSSILKEKAGKSENPVADMQDMTDIKPNNLEKRFLVWAKKYKSIDEVPNKVPQSTMEYARNKMRIRLSNLMMLATIFACIGYILSGKAAARRGETVQKMNLDWHKKYNEEQEAKKKFERNE